MRYIYLLPLAIFVLTGCATKMAYLNTAKTADEIQRDKDACEASAGQKKLDQCMQEKGYKVVSEEEAQKAQGFKGLWVKPGTDFKAYEMVFIDRVDVGPVKAKNAKKIPEQDIDNLGKEMSERFSAALNAVLPVAQEEAEAAGKKALRLSLKLNDIAQTKIGLNTALKAVGQLSKLPMPSGSQGMSSFEGTICDFSTKEKLIAISDESKSDKNASLAGLEGFEKWKHAYNTMDYWADHLAALLAKERGQEYKSRLGFKLVDF